MIDFKNFNLEALKRLTSSQSVNDFDKFLDDIPKNIGMDNLTVVLVVWAIAAGALLFSVEQSDKLLSLQKELNQVKALKPPVPTLEYKAVDKKKLEAFSKQVSDTYKGLKISIRQGGKVVLTAQDTDFFPQFISGISYFQRGAKNWKVNITDMCVGRECTGSKLRATLKVEKIRVRPPKI